MTGETESQPEESRSRGETGEGGEDREQQNLDDATLEPGALIEQSGDFQQAEALTSGFIAVTDASTTGSPPAMEDVLPMEMAEIASGSEESEHTGRGSTGQEEETGGGQGIITEVEIISSPEGGQEEADSGSERDGAAVMTAIPLGIPGSGDSSESESEAAGVLTAVPLAGEESSDTAALAETGDTGPGGETDLDTSEAPVDESQAEAEEELEANAEALGEGEEGWNPPPMYAHADSSGNVTIVDADGKPIDSPPNVTKVMGNDGKVKYLASYQAGGKTYSFEVTDYISSLSDLYVGYDTDGKLTVVNGKGEKVDSPPVFTKFVDDKGVEKYAAYYPGAGAQSGVVLGSYAGSLQGCYAHYGQDGKVTIVDADGNPLTSQPVTYKFVDDKGVEQVTAYYPGTGEGGKVTLSSYTASLQGCYAHYGQDGKVTIVDADGNPLKCQPQTYKFVDDKGVEQVSVYYPGAGEGSKVIVSSYTASLQGCYAHYGQDGKVTIVDADGKPLASQPLTYKFVDNKGVEQVSAYYPGAGQGGMTTLSSYTTSLQNCYAHYGQDGKVTIVGADGKPLASQPLTYKIVDSKGVQHILAYYPGDKTKTTLTNYLPPASTPKGGTSA